MRTYYNPKLKEKARRLRKESTKAEIRLWKHLKGGQMMGYDFHRQKPAGNYILDFFCNRLALAIEVDGYTHRLPDVVKKDTVKEEHLRRMGISVLRFKDEEVMNHIVAVMERIELYAEKHTPKSPLDRGDLSCTSS